MKSSWQIGRIMGIPLQFHWTFLLVGLWLLYDSWETGVGVQWDNFQWLLTWVVTVFLAVLLHELGHALVASHWRIDTQKIVLYPIGGGAFLERMPEDPWQEISIALAGPMVNFLLAALVAPFIWWGGNANLPLLFQLFLNPHGNIVVFDAATWEYVVVVFFILNLLLGAFNLIPAFPLDGGRVLRALLSKYFTRTQATIIAGRVGMLGATILLGTAIYLSDIVFGVGALFVFLLAWIEIQVQRRRERLSSALVKDYLTPDFRRLYLSPYASLQTIREEITHWPDQPILLLDGWQHPHGVTDKAALLSQELDDYAADPITAVVGRPAWEALHPEENLLHAAEKLDKYQLYAFPVMDHYGRIHGLLDRSTIEAVIEGRKPLPKK